jgi:hypothetical protein
MWNERGVVGPFIGRAMNIPGLKIEMWSVHTKNPLREGGKKSFEKSP